MGRNSTTNSPGRGVLRRHYGEDLAEQIQSLTASSVLNAIFELGSNSYDADATLLHFDYHPDKDYLGIADNGQGMTPTIGLPSFYRLGDSDKKTCKVSLRGRPYIGNHGVATVLLKLLGSSYRMVTTRDNMETVVSETFDGPLRCDSDIPYETRSVKDRPSGTLIEIRGLKFQPSRAFNLERLCREIPWNLPLDKDFRVYVNGKELNERSISHEAEFQIQASDPLIGPVHGSLYITKSRTPMAGIHVFVNGRRVGKPTSFAALDINNASLRTRAVGIVYADGLAPIINFGREEFIEDPQGHLARLQGVLRPALSQARSYIDAVADERRSQKDAKATNMHSVQLRDMLRKANIAPVDAETEVDLFAYDPPSMAGSFVHSKNLLSINSDNPLLRVQPTLNPNTYAEALLSLAVDVLAIERRGAEAEDFSFVDLLEERAKIYDSLRPALTTVGKTSRQLFPLKVYGTAEAADALQMPLGGVRYLAKGGLISEEKATGQALLDLQQRTRGFKSLHDLVYEHAANGNLGYLLDKAHTVLAAAGQGAAPFVQNLGMNGTPCYMVDEHVAEDVWKILHSEDLRKGAGADAFEGLSSTYLLLEPLRERFKLTAGQMDEILRFTLSKVLPLRCPRGWKPPAPRQFHLGDFTSAYQQWRKVAS